MKHVYKVSGIQCGACNEKVEKALKVLDTVVDANVELSDGTTTVEMTSHVTLEALQKALTDTNPRYRLYLSDKAAEHYETNPSEPVAKGTAFISVQCTAKAKRPI